MRKIRVCALPWIVLPLLLLCPDPANAEGCERHLGSAQTASSCGQIGYTFDSRTKTFQARTKLAASDDPDGSKYLYSILAACDGSLEVAGGNAICANFGNCPPKVGPDGAVMRSDRMQGLRAPRNNPNHMLPFGDAICMYSGRSIPLADVVAAVREELVKQVGRPQITVQPATRGLIHWPVLFSAPAQHRTTLDITRPLAGAITADPAYTWDLGGGQHATGAGHRYLPAMDPTRTSSDDYYVKGTYDDPGEHPIHLRLTWSATIHLGALDVDLDPIVFADDAAARVVSATNRLYDAVPAG